MLVSIFPDTSPTASPSRRCRRRCSRLDVPRTTCATAPKRMSGKSSAGRWTRSWTDVRATPATLLYALPGTRHHNRCDEEWDDHASLQPCAASRDRSGIREGAEFLQTAQEGRRRKLRGAIPGAGQVSTCLYAGFVSELHKDAEMVFCPAP